MPVLLAYSLAPHPFIYHPAHLRQRCGGTSLRCVHGRVPIGHVIEIDDVASRNLGNVAQRHMVIAHQVPSSRNEFVHAEPRRGGPNFLHQRPGITPRAAVLLLVDLQVCVAHHIQQHAPPVFVLRWLAHVLLRKPRTAEKIGVPPFDVDQLFPVEEHEVDPHIALQLRHQVRQFHQHGNATRSVVGADKRPRAVLHRIGVLIWQRPRVVMRREQDPFFPLRMPFDDNVRQRHVAAAERVRRLKLLQRHLAAKPLKMVANQLLLLLHTRRSAGPRAQREICCK